MKGSWRVRMFRERLRVARDLRRAERAVAAFPKVREKQMHSLPYELIVSLTSYPVRFPTLEKTLRSILDQTLASDRTILWIAYDDIDLIPAGVRGLEKHGLEIRACKDIRSYKKLIPALRDFPNAAIVTADDDAYYPKDWLAQLVKAHVLNPRAVTCVRAHLAQIDENGNFSPYSKWQTETSATSDVSDLKLLFPTGVGGVLYPPKSLHPMVTEEAQFKALCPTADDVWFFWMARMAGTPHDRIESTVPNITWKNSQEVGLVHENLFGNANDAQIAAMLRQFSLPLRYKTF